MRRIFADFEIINLSVDHEAPGVFVKARKPEDYKPIDLSGIALYSRVLGRRTKDIPDLKDMPLARRFVSRLLSSKARWLLPGTFIEPLGKTLLDIG